LKFSLNLPPSSQTSLIKIYSIEGIEVFKMDPTTEVVSICKIDVSGFSPGVYYVMVGDRVCRFIKM